VELRRVDRQRVVRPDLVRADVVGPHLERRLLDLAHLEVTPATTGVVQA
jgi:hypothetical protein